MATKSQQTSGYDALGQQDPSVPYGFVPQPGQAPPPQGEYPQQREFTPPPAFAAVAESRGNLDPESEHDEVDRFSFDDRTIRRGFIRKVYGILMIQLLITTGFIALFVLSEDVKLWSRRNSYLFWVAFATTFIMIIALGCCESVRRKAPTNFICLGIFTIAEGFMLGTFSSAFKAESVLLAIGITTVIVLALTIFSFQTKWDFTVMGGFLFAILIVFILFGIFALFLPRSSFPILHIVYACIGAMLFSFYLIYDTQLMMGGKHKYSISPEEYIFAALNLYLDIVNIFIYILSIVGSRN